MKTSIFLTSFLSTNASGSNPFTSAANRVLNAVGVELGDRPRPALTGQQAVPGGLGPDAHRRHQADAGNHNSPAHYPSVAGAGATRAYFFLLCDSMY